MSGYWVDVRPFQHGYGSNRCWALVGWTSRACSRRQAAEIAFSFGGYLCSQHAAQAKRNGVRFVRLTADQLRRLLADEEASGLPASA
jgi:hypothetical protein